MNAGKTCRNYSQEVLPLIRWADYFYILRPVLFFPAWTTLMAGYLAVHGRKSLLPWEPVWWDAQVFLVCLSVALVLGAGFIVNQLQDTETDRINAKNFFLSNGIIHPRAARVESLIVFIAGMILAGWLSVDLLLLFLAGAVWFMVGYNYPPFEWKNKAWSSLLTNAAMGGFAFAAGWIAEPLALTDFLEDVAPYLFYNTALFLLTTIPDVEGDRQTGKVTFAVAYGMQTTILFSAVFYGISLMIAMMAGDLNIGIPALMLLPFYIALILRRDKAWTLRTLKFGLFFFSLVMAYYFPGYFVVMVAFYFLTRQYYRKRFNLSYPNFSGN